MNEALGFLAIALGYSAPLAVAALGGLFSEESGVVNIALEGIMMVGAFVSASAAFLLEPHLPGAVWMALALGAAAGIAFSSLHAIACVSLGADQVVAGIALNMLASGLTIFLCQAAFGQSVSPAFMAGLSGRALPRILGSVPPAFPIALVLAPLSGFILYRSPLGLRLRACGANPRAAWSAGLDVKAIRWMAVLASGALAGLGGGILVLSQDTQFSASSIHGSGFLAIACLIFGRRNPWGILAASVFFGSSFALSLYAGDIPILRGLSPELPRMIPYLLTILALVASSRESRRGIPCTKRSAGTRLPATGE